jgi:predicted GNAT family acetyltransferase
LSFKDSQDKKYKTVSERYTNTKRTGWLAYVVQYFPNKHKLQVQIPVQPKKVRGSGIYESEVLEDVRVRGR